MLRQCQNIIIFLMKDIYRFLNIILNTGAFFLYFVQYHLIIKSEHLF